MVFFITDDGYLISNYHVVKSAAKVRLLTGASLIAASVVKVDAANNLTDLLKLLAAQKCCYRANVSMGSGSPYISPRRTAIAALLVRTRNALVAVKIGGRYLQLFALPTNTQLDAPLVF
jgi:hypothetical protein